MAEIKKSWWRRAFGALGRFISWLRVTTLNVVFLLFLVMLFAALSSHKPVQLPDSGALLIAPTGFVVDQRSYTDPLEQLLGEAQDEPGETVLWDIIDSIEYAAKDARVTALVLKLDGVFGLSTSSASEIITALEQFRAAGKPIYAAGEYYTQAQYLVAAQADEVYLHPMGGVFLEGFSVYRNYFRGALEKLKVKFHLFRVGEYKSAMEPFIRDDMSEQARAANLQWLNGLWGFYVNKIAERREVSVAQLQSYADAVDEHMAESEGSAAAMALRFGLVDEILNRAAMEQRLIERVGADLDGAPQLIDMASYLQWHEMQRVAQPVRPKIGLIVAQGEIVDGDQPSGVVGGDSLAAQIREATEDGDLQALVLRVNSPGGSVFASEVIREALAFYRHTGRPLVVSMGSMAASGGYWISAEADRIFATPTTLTGSIGIFGAIPTFADSLAELGVSVDGVGTTQVAGANRIDRDLNPVAARAVQSSIEFGYRRFLQIVAEGREMSVSEVDKLARGRVWLGEDALKLGLVDGLGGLQIAVDAAAELAELEGDYELEFIEPSLTPFELFMQGLSQVQSRALQNQLGAGLTNLLSSFSKVWHLQDRRAQFVLCSECEAL